MNWTERFSGRDKIFCGKKAKFRGTAISKVNSICRSFVVREKLDFRGYFTIKIREFALKWEFRGIFAAVNMKSGSFNKI